jgi:hypothetical protein
MLGGFFFVHISRGRIVLAHSAYFSKRQTLQVIFLESPMHAANEASALADRLAAPFNAIVSRHRASLMPMLGGSASSARAALANDEAVRKIAVFCYPLLPGIMRLAIKEPVFVSFVMNNREQLLARLTVDTAPATGT